MSVVTPQTGNAQARRVRLKSELDRWLPILITQLRPEKIILFGSYPIDQINEWSDIDLVIVKEMKEAFLDRTRRILELLRPQVGVDILVYTPQEFERLTHERAFIREEIAAKGKVIYERSK